MSECNSLYVIGNGFDIHHGIASRYSDFKDYVLDNDSKLFEIVTEYLVVEENWSDLEAAFAYLDVDQVLDSAGQFLHSYSVDDWSDSFHHDYQYELDKIVSAISIGIKEWFCSWIEQLEIPSRSRVLDRVLTIHQGARYLKSLIGDL